MLKVDKIGTMKKLIRILLLFVLLVALTSCSLLMEYYTVEFDSDGGSYTPQDQLIQENGTVTEPKSPDKASTRGFMWWVTEDGTPYDFSSPVTSSFTLKAVYWPANGISSSDPETNKVQEEVLCLHYLVKKLVGSKLMDGGTVFGSVFSGQEELVNNLLRNALQCPDYVTIDGEMVSLSNSELSKWVEWKKSAIENNSTEVSNDGTITKYALDISGLKLCMGYSIWGDDYVKRTEETADISVKGTFLKILDDRYEFHVQVTVNGKVYPVLHAIATQGVISFNYKGLTSYVPEVELW